MRMVRPKARLMACAAGAWLVLAGTLASALARAELVSVSATEQTLGTPAFVATDSVLLPVVVATETSRQQQSALFWIDSRPGDARTMTTVFVSGPPPVQSTLYAARFSADGKPLDPGGLLVGRYLANPTSLRAAGSSGRYTVVWSDTGEIYGVTVAANSTPTSAIAWDSVRLLSKGNGKQHSPEIGCSRFSCVITWVDELAGNARVVAYRTDPELGKLTAISLPAPPTTAVQLEPKVVFPESASYESPQPAFVVLWREAANYPTGVRAVRIGVDNTSVDPTERQLPSSPLLQGPFSVAGTRRLGFCLAWESPDASGDIHASLFDGDLNTTFADVTIADGAAAQLEPRVAANAQGFTIVWEEPSLKGNVLRSRVLDSDGSLGSLLTLTDARLARKPAISSAPDSPVTVAWTDGTPPQMNAMVAQLGASGDTVSAAEAIASTRAAEYQDLVGLASNGSEYLVVWSESSSRDATTSQGYMATVSATGQLRRGPTVVPHAGRPIWAGSHYLLLWAENGYAPGRSRVRAARVAPDFEWLDPDGFTVLESDATLTSPALAFDGKRTLVVASPKLAAFIDEAGGVRAVTGFEIPRGGAPTSLAHGDEGFLYVWEGQAAPPSATHGYQVQAVLLDAEGRPSPKGWFPVSDVMSNTRRRPAVAYGEGQYSVVYQADPLGVGSVRPAATRVASDGTIVDTKAIALAAESPAGYINQPSVVFDGTHFVTSWSAAYRGYLQTQATYVARTTPAGAVLDPTGIVLGFPAQHEQVNGPSVIASLGSGWTLIGYTREDVELGWTARVKLRAFMDPSANGASCFLDADCASGRCEVGRCVSEDAGLATGTAGTSFAGSAGLATSMVGTSFAGSAGSDSGAGGIGKAAVAGNTASLGGRPSGTALPLTPRRRQRAPSEGDAGSELDGCSCRLPPTSRSLSPLAVLAGLGVLVSWRRNNGQRVRGKGKLC